MNAAGSAAPLSSLSVVMPVFNEPAWVRESLTAVLAEGARAGIDLDVVVVDDGSTDETAAVLDALAAETGIRVVHQPNAGRMAARTTGVQLAAQPLVLLLDSRVIIQPGALSWLRAQVAEHPERVVWCGHVDTAPGNPYASFWSGLAKVGWRAYASQPRLVSFGIEEFDAYPKGTGCLMVPRDLMLRVADDARSLFADARFASDDTRLLRDMATAERIWLSPEFRFLYHGKAGLRGFGRQAFFRGTTFVDGYLGHAGVGRRLIVGGAAAGLAVLGLSVRRPAVGAAAVAAVGTAVPAVVAVSGGTREEVRSAAALTPVFTAVFGAGVLRGLVLALTRLVRDRAV